MIGLTAMPGVFMSISRKEMPSCWRPSVLVRKKFGDHVSVAYNYYADQITGHVDTFSGASVDATSPSSGTVDVRSREGQRGRDREGR